MHMCVYVSVCGGGDTDRQANISSHTYTQKDKRMLKYVILIKMFWILFFQTRVSP